MGDTFRSPQRNSTWRSIILFQSALQRITAYPKAQRIINDGVPRGRAQPGKEQSKILKHTWNTWETTGKGVSCFDLQISEPLDIALGMIIER
jgi:hypothetical protein